MKKLLLASLLALPCMNTFADNHNFSLSLNLVSDRLLRGFSLTDENPSNIAGLHYDHGSGFYAKAVNFTNIQITGDDGEVLTDAVIGRTFAFDQFALDAGYIHHYFSETNEAESGEWFVGTIVDNYKLHYYRNNKLEEHYLDFNYGYPIADGYQLLLHAGRLTSDVNSAMNFSDYSVGVVSQLNDFQIGLTFAYNDNEEALRDVAGSHVVFNISTVW
ncbi:TorF family putative porin [Pleionea sp. CnH1-48]|uniref:TorF family putative porin n=1 Tax=Pleionea sp. CnH1-48 TaxID=2954494 RepID=UPI002097986A|nr:TorF family putative porin [Pleionea sp. CnH1-48]MCO7227493.1 TorF family putative porin [Pleionea sp. CnH1-48]